MSNYGTDYIGKCTGIITDATPCISYTGALATTLAASYPGWSLAFVDNAGTARFFRQSSGDFSAADSLPMSGTSSLTLTTLGALAPSVGDQVLMSVGQPYSGRTADRWVVQTILDTP